MTKVKITSMPPGGAPVAIREQWIGVEMPLEQGPSEPGILRSVTGGKPNPKSYGGFPVKTEDAIQALREQGREEAAEWWENWFLSSPSGKTLVFAASCGELVDEAVEAQPKTRAAAMTAANRRS